MRALIVAIGIVFATGTLATHAWAQNYPWCAYYNTGDGGGTNCGFVTREQCMVTVSGIGGHCEPNNQYVPQSGSAAPGNADRR
jgi:Protein of unknown function (DUF3551)